MGPESDRFAAARPEVRVLGPLHLALAGEPVDLGGPRQRIVFAVLALETNRAVSLERLAAAVYGERPPSTSRVQVQICVSALRRLLGEFAGIATRPPGYVLEIPDDCVDVRRFEEQVARARRLRDERRLAEAVESYRGALGEWRGPALAGLDGVVVRSLAERLDAQRLDAVEDCVELELQLGRHRDLVGEIAALVEQHPLRERLYGHLMLALYRSGRQADALEVYRRVRRTLVDELGIEPSASLRDLEQVILTGEARWDGWAVPANSAVFAAVTPRLLPTDIADFTGRAAQTESIGQWLTEVTDRRATETAGSAPPRPDRHAVPVLVVSGKPGVGKTTLAVRVAHQAADRYRDGQLFADLHGKAIRPVQPRQVLERFLRILGVPGAAVPESLDERAELYRQLLSDRQVLVVLDNAADEGQVLPLLPGTPTAAVVITSRGRLAGVPGATHIGLEVFDTEQAVELLSRVAGARRLSAEPNAASHLAALCGHLPLALRIAGGRLASRPHWTVEQFVERLEDGARRLDELSHGSIGVRPSIAVSYEGMSDDARQLFRRLAVLDFPDFSAWAAAALLDRHHTDAQDLLDDLVDAHLLDPVDGAPGVHRRYRFHDLIRAFARERLTAEEPEPDRAAALKRALGALLYLAGEARRGAYGGDYLNIRSHVERWPLPESMVARLLNDPLSWLAQERATLLAGVRQAAGAGLVELCWDLAETAVTLYEVRVHLDDWRVTHEVALDAARRAGDLRGEAVMSYSTGSLHIVQRRFDDARRKLKVAADLFGSGGDDNGAALAIRNIAFVDRLQGDLDAAERRYTQSLGIFRRTGDLAAAAYVLQSIAVIKVERGDFEAAQALLEQALPLSQRAGSRRVEAQVQYRIGETHLRLADPPAAADAFTRALSAVKDTGDAIGTAFALCGLGTAHLRAGKLAESATALDEALCTANAAGDPLTGAHALLGLGELKAASGREREAAVLLRRAIEMFRALKASPLESQALALLARITPAADVGSKTNR